MKFLIADDSITKQDLLRQLVSDRWPVMEILSAFSTEEAESLVREHADVIAGFIDYQMPSKDGPWLIRKWRELEKKSGNHAIIILATAQDGPMFDLFAKQAMEAGADMAVSTKQSMKGSGRHLADAVEMLGRKLG